MCWTQNCSDLTNSFLSSSGVNILQNPKELSPNRISNISLNSCVTQTFIKVNFYFSFKMIKLFPRFMKRGNISPKKYLGIMRNIHPWLEWLSFVQLLIKKQKQKQSTTKEKRKACWGNYISIL